VVVDVVKTVAVDATREEVIFDALILTFFSECDEGNKQ
jgi:hypothetical protein